MTGPTNDLKAAEKVIYIGEEKKTTSRGYSDRAVIDYDPSPCSLPAHKQEG